MKTTSPTLPSSQRRRHDRVFVATTTNDDVVHDHSVMTTLPMSRR